MLCFQQICWKLCCLFTFIASLDFKMVRKCFVCSRLDVGNPTISFHKFPSRVDQYQLWVSLLGIGVENIPKLAYVCSDHFDPQGILTKCDGKKYLMPGTLPKIGHNLLIHSESSDSTASASPPRFPVQDFFDGQTLTAQMSLPRENEFGTPQAPFMDQTNLQGAAGPSGLSKINNFSTNEEILGTASILQCQSSSPPTETASETEDVQPDLSAVVSSRKRKRYSYVGDLESSDFSTPEKRKRNLKIIKQKLQMKNRTIKTLQRSVKRLTVRVTTLKELLNHLKETHHISDNGEHSIKASLTGVPKALFERILKGPSRQKYNETLRCFALTLSFYSPKAYAYVRDTFNKSLPDPSTISKWFRTVNGSPGFTEESLAAVQLKQKQSTKPILCNLVFDEMSIRKLVEWTGKKFTGYVDIGTHMNSDCLEEATQALVFLLTCVNGSWKVPVGYFFISGLSAREKAGLVNKCIEFLYDEGRSTIRITSVTFDGAPVNLSTAEALGAQFDDTNDLKTDFPHPVTKEPILIILDVSHMIKLVRNCFGSQNGIKNIDGEEIQWQFVERLETKQREEGLHAATKLKLRHIHWDREKMKVKLATQTMSKSVSDAITFCREDLQDPQFIGSEATSEFLHIFNDIFDILNSRNYWAKYKYKLPMSSKTEALFHQKFDDLERYIKGLTLKNKPILCSGRKTGFLGLLITIKSVRHLYQRYVKDSSMLSYLLTYKLSQDHLELLFSVIRSKGGFNNNPSARQFEATYKRLLVHSQLRASKSANALDLGTISILTAGSGIKLISKEVDQQPQDNEMKQQVEDCMRLDELFGSSLTSYVDDIVIYIAGFIVRGLKHHISCHKCRTLLEAESSYSWLQERKKYGKLINASNIVCHICKKAEKYFRCFNNSIGIFNKNVKNLLNILIINVMDTELLRKVYDHFGDHLYDGEIIDNHGVEVTKLILEKYFRIRIFHETNMKRDIQYIKRVRSINTKTILFRNE